MIFRARFEELNNKLFRKTLKPLEQILSDSGLNKNDIDEIVMVGGSTRIPKIQELIKNFFNGKELNRGINPDEAVAIGASIQAAVIGNHYGEPVPPVIDATSLSLGIETVGGLFNKIIEKNTNFPIDKSKIFSTHQDNQESVMIQIFQGESSLTKRNRKLGEFMLSGIPSQPRGVPQIEVKFGIDVDGLLQVQAFERSSKGNKQSLVITTDRLNLDETTIKRMKKEAEEREEEDKLTAKRINAKNQFENSIYSLKNKLYDKKEEIDEGGYESLMDLYQEMSEWFDDNQDTAEYDDFVEKQQEFDEIVGQIFGRYDGNNDMDDQYDDDYFDHEDL